MGWAVALIMAFVAIVAALRSPAPATPVTTLAPRPEPTPTPRRVHFVGYGDIGGDTSEFFNKYQRWADANDRVEVHGSCMSACAMALLWDNGCVAPDARVGYHQGYFSDDDGRYIGPSSSATALQREAMPRSARSLPLPPGYTGKMVWLTYRDFPPDYQCPPRKPTPTQPKAVTNAHKTSATKKAG